MPNPFVHIELATTDLGKAKDFYGKLFNWQLEDVPDGSYTMIKVGQGTGGGMMKNPMPGGPSLWIPYVEVDDIRAATDKAKSLGGTIYRDVTDAMGHGHFSIVGDPTGAVFALWKQTPAQQQQ